MKWHPNFKSFRLPHIGSFPIWWTLLKRGNDANFHPFKLQPHHSRSSLRCIQFDTIASSMPSIPNPSIWNQTLPENNIRPIKRWNHDFDRFEWAFTHESPSQSIFGFQSEHQFHSEKEGVWDSSEHFPHDYLDRCNTRLKNFLFGSQPTMRAVLIYWLRGSSTSIHA